MKKIYFILLLILSFTINMTKVNAQSVTNGTYIIKSTADNNKVFDATNGLYTNGTNIQLYTSNNTNAQKWIVKYQQDGYYTIASALNENQVIDISNAQIANKNKIQLYQNNNTNAQRWNIVHKGKSSFEIRSKLNNDYCLDLTDGRTTNTTKIQLYKCNNTAAQRFKFVEVVESKQVIEDGTYTISNSSNENLVVDVANGQTANKTNIQLYNSNNTDAQKWNIKYLSDGYYSITSKLNDNKCLDVSDAVFLSSTNVQLYNCNNTDSQRWIIRDLGNGDYNILTKKDALSLDLTDGIIKSGTNVQIFYNNGTIAQKFKLKKIDDSSGGDQPDMEQTLKSGIYTIVTSLDANKVVEVANGYSYDNVNIQLYKANNTNSQKWYITKGDDGYYTIRSGLNSSLYMANDSNVSGANILTSTKETKWIIDYIDNNKFYIISKDTGLYLNVNNSSTANGTKINLFTKNESNAQKFSFVSTKIAENSKTFSDGYYTINSKLDSNKVIDVNNGSKNNGTNIQLYSSNNSNAQIWYLKHTGNGYYGITSAMNPNTSLELANGYTTNGTNIQLYKSNNSDAQFWKLKDDGNGNISIVSKKANICVTVANSSTANKTNIQANTCNNQNNQKFNLVKYNNKKNYTGIDVSQYQGNVDWAKVAASNIGFVILRAGYGDNWTSQDDTKFVRNVQELEKYNIPYGVYLYSYAINVNGSTSLNADSESATSEAEHVLRLLRSVSYKPNLKTSVYLDMEDSYTLKAGKNGLTNIANKFCSIIETNGYGCGVYASTSWLNNNLNTKNIANNYDIWVAEWPYGSSPSPSYTTAFTLKPSYKLTDYRLWQFSSRGSISGISGNVDVDIGYNIFD